MGFVLSDPLGFLESSLGLGTLQTGAGGDVSLGIQQYYFVFLEELDIRPNSDTTHRLEERFLKWKMEGAPVMWKLHFLPLNVSL